MKTAISTTIDFGHGGNSRSFIVAGWSDAEGSHTCAVDGFSTLCVPTPHAPFGFFIEVDWEPLLNPPFVAAQPVTVWVNDFRIATHSVTRTGAIAFRCPPPAPHEPRLLIRFEHPGSLRPSTFLSSDDTRQIALSVRRLRILILHEPWQPPPPARSHVVVDAIEDAAMIAQAEAATGVPIGGLLRSFEMLAGNCDMGLALRSLGHDSLSLLRFGGALAEVTSRGLDTDFAGLGENLHTEIANNPISEWMVKDSFGLRTHSGRSSVTVSEEEVLAKFKMHQMLLKRKFLEDLEIGEKIFVYADHKTYDQPLAIEYVMPLFLALRRRSDARLLWVRAASSMDAQRGSVREVLPGLALGVLDVLAPPVLIGGGISVSGWLTVLCNAWLAFARPVRSEGRERSRSPALVGKGAVA